MVIEFSATTRSFSPGVDESTYLPLAKMTAISQMIFSDEFSRMKKLCILIGISLKIAPKGPIYNNPAFGQIVDWRRTGDKPL